MGLVSKLKNILFEEEEVEIPVIEKKEKVVAPTQEVKEEKMVMEQPQNYQQGYNNFYQDLEPAINQERKLEEKNKYQEEYSEREVFKTDKTFNFPAFDEEEFESSIPKRNTNVLEYERKKQEKRNEYRRPERKEEIKEVKTKFKPSPIISPVYGILDKNYTPDDITSRTDTINAKTLDVDSVRKKAFGSLEESQVKNPVLEEKNSQDEKILEEKLEKARTIDELLKDSSDEVIDVPQNVINDDKSFNEIDSLEDLEPAYEENFEEDTLESDLFDLIDSMYENREDGE